VKSVEKQEIVESRSSREMCDCSRARDVSRVNVVGLTAVFVQSREEGPRLGSEW
jgi:hypothetical protein